MYQVFSQQRPSHPQWAAVAAAGVLLITLLLAALLARYKAQGQYVPLAERSQTFAAARLKARLPAQWDVVHTDQSQSSGITAVLKPSGDTGEMLVLFRGLPQPNGTVSVEVADALRQLVRGLGGESAENGEIATIGHLPAWRSEFRPKQAQTRFLASAAISPNGQVFGVLLAVPRPPNEADHTLLSEICDHLKLTDVTQADNAQQLMNEIGVTFAPSSDMRFFDPAVTPSAKRHALYLVGGEGEAMWHLKIARVPLIGSRTNVQIVQNNATNTRQLTALEEDINETSINGRPTAQITLAGDEEQASLLIWCTQIDQHTGLLLLGRHEPSGENALARACQEIAAQAKVTSYTETLNIQRAIQLGRQQLTQLRKDTLTKAWASRAGQTENFVIQSPAMTFKREVRTYQDKVSSDGHHWWTVRVGYIPMTPALILPVQIDEQWTIRDDLAGYGRRYQRSIRGQLDVNYSEIRLPEHDDIRCELVADQNEPLKWSIDVDASYGCEPVLLEIAARLAKTRTSQPAFCTVTEYALRQPCYWIMTAMGEAILPAPGSEQTAQLVRLIRDYDPDPIDLYFDENARLSAINFDNLMWQQRPGTGEPAE